MIDLNRIYEGECIETMKTWPENFVDTIITDPPYGLHFMGKSWDKFGGPLGKDHQTTRERSGSMHAGQYDEDRNPEFQEWCKAWATEALRIAKPGATMLVCGGPRKFHRMTCGIEDAGWQIRDCLMWLYGSGFPKSLDISKAIDKAKGAEREVVGKYESFRPNTEAHENGKYAGELHTNGNFTVPASDLSRLWSGWGTALKPAWEPIIVAMKPCDGTFAENAQEWGVAGLNVDGGRIEGGPKTNGGCSGKTALFGGGIKERFERDDTKGRWPANLILDEEAAGMLDAHSGGLSNCGGPKKTNHDRGMFGIGQPGEIYRDSGGASRFFYVAKSARAERNEGCEGMENRAVHRYGAGIGEGHTPEAPVVEKNHHPTVKPLELMKYLCMLTRTPTGGIVLDPFAGSGTTLWAAEFHNRPWIGIEMNPEYVAIANARIARERAQMKMAI